MTLDTSRPKGGAALTCLPFSFFPGFLTATEADQLFEHSRQLDWQQNEIKMFGKLLQLPRLEAMQGDPGCSYRYSNVVLEPEPWSEPLLSLRNRIQAATGHRFNVAIGNRYLDGSHHIGWHRDDSPEMGKLPAIASISLGDARKFQLKSRETKEVFSYDLEHGSLLLMHSGCQSAFAHRLVKTAKPVGERINWTFRPHVRGEGFES